MNAVLIYDLTHRQDDVKAELKKLDYFDYWTEDNVKYHIA